MKYGRVDASGPEQCPEEGRLPGKITVIKCNMYGVYIVFGKAGCLFDLYLEFEGIPVSQDYCRK